MKNYRIVKRDFPNSSRYEVQVMVWKTAPKSHGENRHSSTQEEARRHIEHLIHRTTQEKNENVVFETDRTNDAGKEKIRAYEAVKGILDQAEEKGLRSEATLAFLSATLDARISELEAALN